MLVVSAVDVKIVVFPTDNLVTKKNLFIPSVLLTGSKLSL